MELTELCQELRNWFVIDKTFGEFTISEGKISLSDFLQEGQYYRIIGSVFNDGVHVYGDSDLKDEKPFEGAVWSMAVPPEVLSLLNDINSWLSKYGEVVSSPYSSESFGGYSYTKAVGNSSGNSNGSGNDYRSMFASRLNKWRKV